MSREAMQLALEALEDANDVARMEFSDEDYYSEAINALRQALETEQEPVAWRYALDASVEGPRWIYIDKDPHQWLKGPSLGHALIESLYTSPQQSKPWVGLTADEIWKCNKAKSGWALEFHICYAHQNVLDFAEAIEAKLKEKNQ
jgi:hypothetical protein